ncbi:hypothetical protein D6C77_02775 [Aureobasidium pullulans]|nr:hypothetical protein D6C97_02929 [Aureobasidium pullulans]TIA62398.1 hypothetical protein D6C77_02775 [Aureobasidium pullulans]
MTTIIAAPTAHAVPRDQGLSSLAHLAASAPPMATRTTPPGTNAPTAVGDSPRSAPRHSVEDNVSPKRYHISMLIDFIFILTMTDSARAAGLRSVTKIKKEPPASPNPSAKPRPRRLDLSVHGATGRGPQTARPAPLTARDSAGLAIHDLGVACLSPGFQTQDPTMRSQLQRSLDVREQQRQIIEARQKGVKPPSDAPGTGPGAESAQFGMPQRTPSTSRRKGPPPGLSITAPSAATFSNERVIQSAPLHHSFTGLRPHAHQPSGLSQTSHIHHVPATQTANRLPPISDVFAHDSLQAPPSARPPTAMFATGHSPSIGPPPLQSPSMMQHQHNQGPPTGRGREFKSAEEAVQEMSRGREDLLPKIVHYGGAQPPTPPSPMPPSQQSQHPGHPQSYPHPPQRQSPHASGAARVDALRSEHSQSQMAGRRRPRDEYEREHGSPLGQQEAKRATYHPDASADWRSGMSNQEKRDEFLRLCSRAWDLFHS